MNRTTTETKRSVTPSSYLGKRKRSTSPTKVSVDIASPKEENSISNVIQDLKQFNASTAILGAPLDCRSNGSSPLKRQKANAGSNTIADKILHDSYTTTRELLDDLDASIALLGESTQKQQSPKAEELKQIQHLLDSYSQGKLLGLAHSQTSKLEILSVRSNVEGGGARQLFTGLRERPPGVKLEDINPTTLPSGFEVVETGASEPNLAGQAQSRTFGEVFGQQRNIQELEQPQAPRVVHDNLLSFDKELGSLASRNKNDFRTTVLPAGAWTQYNLPDRKRGEAFQAPDRSAKNVESLFKSAYSSFAPSQDNGLAIMTSADRARRWYSRHGSQALHRTGLVRTPSQTYRSTTYPPISEDFQDIIDQMGSKTVQKEPTDDSQGPDDLLQEVADMLDTLVSYQQIRAYEPVHISDLPAKPSEPEADTFEILRNQLKILVNSLPPHAVAKLNGDQLEALSVDTHIVVSTSDLPGTGQRDEFTMHKERIAQMQANQAAQAAQAARVPPAPAVARNNYSTSGMSTTNYNRHYNATPASNSPAANTPSLPGYAQRNVDRGNANINYNTHTPGRIVTNLNSNYNTQTPHNRNQNVQGASIQQYQKHLQNGYTPSTAQATATGMYSAQNLPRPTGLSTPYSQSPAKSLTNGVVNYRANGITNNYASHMPPYTPQNAHATIQQVKAQAQVQAQSLASPSLQGRANSKTPQPTQPSSNPLIAAAQATAAAAGGLRNAHSPAPLVHATSQSNGSSNGNGTGNGA